MPWPIASDYSEAVQNPSFCFADPDLRSGTLTLNNLGLPKPITGAFACVYQLSGSGRKWAVRCFLREFADQQLRYAAISNHLHAANLRSMVSFVYLPQGIRIGGTWYPILKMEWVEGEPLDRFIARNLAQPNVLQALARQWIELTGALRTAGIAHGDLQHGNVLVTNGNLRLIDYDGMYVPALAGSSSHEEGHRNYQHPSRTGHDFNPQLDNFSAWVIFYSLSAIALDPRLWQLLDGGDEHLLFRREDYEHPADSEAFLALERSGKPEVQALAAHFRSLLSFPLTQIPALDGATVATTAPPTPRPPVGRPEWISDHLQHENTENRTSVPDQDQEQTTLAGASWLVDHLLTDKPLRPLVQFSRFWLERSMCGLTVVLLLVFLFVIRPLHVVALGVSVAAIAAIPVALFGGLFWRYWSLKVVEEKRGISARFAAATQTLHRTEQAIERVRQEQTRIQEPLTELDKRFRAVSVGLGKELGVLQQALDAFIYNLATQRLDLDTKEGAALRIAGEDTQTILNSLLPQRNSIEKSEREEMQKALDQIRRQHVEQFLETEWLANTELPGIGPMLKSRLHAHGIVSAAHVIGRKVRSVEGIGEAKARLLQGWRLQVEQKAAATAPQSLPYQDHSQIQSKFLGMRQSLDGQIELARRNEREKRQAVLDGFASSRSALDRSEREARIEFHRHCEAERIKSRTEQERLRSEIEAVKLRVAAERLQLEAQLVELNGRGFKERLRQCELKRECNQYSNVTFAKFVIKSFGVRRAA